MAKSCPAAALELELELALGLEDELGVPHWSSVAEIVDCLSETIVDVD